MHDCSELTAALHQAQRHTGELARRVDELSAAAAQPPAVIEPPEPAEPTFTDFGERIGQILSLANDEAADIRSSAAAEFEVPLTFRHEALRITFLTAHKATDAEAVDWSVLTDQKMTIVVYMGMTAAQSVRDGLLAAGRSPQTPVGVFARVTRPDSQAVVGQLADLTDLVEAIDGGPAILMIGDVVAHSAPWRSQNLRQRIEKLLEAAE